VAGAELVILLRQNRAAQGLLGKEIQEAALSELMLAVAAVVDQVQLVLVQQTLYQEMGVQVLLYLLQDCR
jgi:hypothetical protein